MSATKNPKEKMAVYETLSEWDEVLLGDKELFREMTEPYIPALLKSARNTIRQERLLGGLSPDIVQPEELVGETLIKAWQARHTRSEQKPLRSWLLCIQEKTLQQMIAEEQKLHAPIVVSLESYASAKSENIHDDENELWRLFDTQVHDRWKDVIPDESIQSIVA